MPSIPAWMLGKHVTAVTAAVQDVAADGTLTDATTGTTGASLVTSTGTLHSNVSPLTFSVGLVDEVEFGATKLTENISAIHRTRAHNVPVSIGYHFTLVEIMRQGAGNNLLAGIWHGGNSSVVKFTFARARRKWVVYAVMTEYTESLQRGKNTARLTCRMVDAGTSSATSTTNADR